MPSYTLPRIKALPDKRITRNKGFYPDNLYKVISDFQQKYHLKKDLDAVLDGDSDATLTAPNNFYGASYAISDSETSKIASAHSLDRLNTLPGGGGGGGGGSKRRCFLISHTDRDPFPRLPSQSVRCKTCCESIQTATATHTQPAALAPAANAASSLSLGGDNSNRGETATNADRDRLLMTGGGGGGAKFARKSYTVSHFDDTYSSNELKREKAKVSSLLLRAPHLAPDSPLKVTAAAAERWRF